MSPEANAFYQQHIASRIPQDEEDIISILDEVVHDAVDHMASQRLSSDGETDIESVKEKYERASKHATNINNGGIEKQIGFLVDNGFSADVLNSLEF
jgi:hypothetical protein